METLAAVLVLIGACTIAAAIGWTIGRIISTFLDWLFFSDHSTV